jgi:O-antigen ligase
VPFILLLILVCLAPLPYGAVQIGAWSLLVAGVGVCLAAWGISVAAGRGPAVWGVDRLKWPLGLLVLVVVWVLFQVSPYSPEAWHNPVWRMAADGLGEPLPARIALDTEAARFAVLRLLAYGAIFWLAVQYGRDAARADRALRFMVASAAVVASVGLIVWAARPDGFLGYDSVLLMKAVKGGRLALPFVNPDHLAAFAGMWLVCSVGILAGDARGLWRPETDRREKLRRLVEAVVVPRWYVVAAIPLLGAVVLFTLSRAGIAATALGLVVLGVALTWRSKPRASRALGLLVLGVVIAGIVFAPTLGRLMDRMADMSPGKRIEIYQTTGEAIAASPWVGYGFGAFSDVYRMRDTNDLANSVDAAHSTVLETIAELGIPAALMLFLAILLPVFWCWKGVRTRRRAQHLPAIGWAASAMLLTHSMVDFPLQIPAIAAAYALIVGFAAAQSVSSQSR